MGEVAAQLLDQRGVLQHGFGGEGAGPQVAAALQLEQIPLGTDHRSLGQALHQTAFLAGFATGFLVGSLSSKLLLSMADTSSVMVAIRKTGPIIRRCRAKFNSGHAEAI